MAIRWRVRASPPRTAASAAVRSSWNIAWAPNCRPSSWDAKAAWLHRLPDEVSFTNGALVEPFDRGRYAGPVGWVGADGNGEWAVALRSAQFDATGRVTAYAGAGIVAESVPERELLETRMKFRPIAEALD